MTRSVASPPFLLPGVWGHIKPQHLAFSTHLGRSHRSDPDLDKAVALLVGCEHGLIDNARLAGAEENATVALFVACQAASTLLWVVGQLHGAPDNHIVAAHPHTRCNDTVHVQLKHAGDQIM